MAGSTYNMKDEHEILKNILSFEDDPLAFIEFTFPWGKENTPLAKYKEPRAWQIDELERIKEHCIENRRLMALGKTPRVYKSATASGRGPGKSAFTAWMNLWHLSCHLGATAITTANTETQLRSKTWAELAKWHLLMINRHWFDVTSLSVDPSKWFVSAIEKISISKQYYYAEAVSWSEDKPDAFAGAHNENGMMVIFDEASGIPAKVWEVAAGFFTDISMHRYWFAFSNPRRNSGAFYECFHKDRDNWYRRNIDSRDVPGLDNTYLNEMVEKHGDDSDFARIEVKGEFPRQGDRQFISRDEVESAIAREIEPDPHAGLIMGVDIARFGTDTTVICFRRGRDARSIPMIKLKNKDNMEVANECAYWIAEYQPDAVCIDAGNGTGVIDRLREVGYKVHEIWFGSKAESEEWSDLRTEMWAKMRDWLPGGCLPEDDLLRDDLVGPSYGFDKIDRIKLEAKEQMRKRGEHSPDAGDALAVTFAVRVARSDMKAARVKRSQKVQGTDYAIFG